MDRNMRVQQRAGRSQEMAMRAERGQRNASKTAQMNKAVDEQGYAYREDYGSEMTQKAYDTYKGKEKVWKDDLTTYDNELNTVQDNINTARTGLNNEKSSKTHDINAANKALDKEAKKTIGSMYRSEQKKWVNVRVVNGDNIEQTYKVPKQGISTIAKEMKGYHQNYVDGGKYYNIDVRMKKSAGGGARGKELHQALGTITRGIEADFYKKAIKPFNVRKAAIKKQYGILNTARAGLISGYNTAIGNLYTQESDIVSRKSDITNARNEHQAVIDTNKTDYDEALKKRQALFAR
jgi:hypothetical protein